MVLAVVKGALVGAHMLTAGGDLAPVNDVDLMTTAATPAVLTVNTDPKNQFAMTADVSNRGVEQSAAEIVLVAGTADLENLSGTNTKIITSERNERIFANPTNAALLGSRMVKAERTRSTGEGSPDNNNPNSSKYERTLTSSVKRLKVDGTRIGKGGEVLTEEASVHHLCRSGNSDGQIEIRFTSIGGVRAIQARYGINKSDAIHAYKANLTAVISAGGKTYRHTEPETHKFPRGVRERLEAAGVPLTGAPIRGLKQSGCSPNP